MLEFEIDPLTKAATVTNTKTLLEVADGVIFTVKPLISDKDVEVVSSNPVFKVWTTC